MTVIAWDGSTVAADKRAVCGNAASKTTKIWLMPGGVVVATAGDAGFGSALVDWWSNGADPANWPAFQSTDDWAQLIIFEPGRPPYSYERQPTKQIVEDSFMAWGSGRDFALGAMAVGATARESVAVACQFDVYCGHGIDEFGVESSL
jgi:20S proteasome alpha/beta subunit